MTGKRKITVDVLIIIALTLLLLVPLLGLSPIRTTAGETADTVKAHSGDYVFFIVSDGEDVPLAAAPTTENPSYVLWICLTSAALMILFVYTGWYLTIRKNLRELSGRLLPSERRAYRVEQGYFHPIRCYQLAREAEDQVASIYNSYL